MLNSYPYLPHVLAVEITFSRPLASSVDVVIRLTEGITTVDGAPLAPVVIRFRTK